MTFKEFGYLTTDSVKNMIHMYYLYSGYLCGIKVKF